MCLCIRWYVCIQIPRQLISIHQLYFLISFIHTFIQSIRLFNPSIHPPIQTDRKHRQTNIQRKTDRWTDKHTHKQTAWEEEKRWKREKLPCNVRPIWINQERHSEIHTNIHREGQTGGKKKTQSSSAESWSKGGAIRYINSLQMLSVPVADFDLWETETQLLHVHNIGLHTYSLLSKTHSTTHA